MVRKGIGFWPLVLIGVLGIAFFLWLLGSVLVPFALGFLWAYLYRPCIKKAMQWGVSSVWSACAMMMITYTFLISMFYALIPFVEYVYTFVLQNWNYYHFLIFIQSRHWLAYFFKPPISQSLEFVLSSGISTLKSLILYLVTNGWLLAHSLASLFLSPLLAFHFMKSWPSLRGGIIALFPSSYQEAVNLCIQEVDRSFSAYLRGQTKIALVLALYYSVGLTALSLNFGWIVGVLTGLLIFLPYIGFLLCLTGACALSIAQWGWGTSCLNVLLLYITGAVLESGILTPWLMGKKLHLHPLWIFFSILAGGSLAGMLGIFLALPVASVLKGLWSVASSYRSMPHSVSFCSNEETS